MCRQILSIQYFSGNSDFRVFNGLNLFILMLNVRVGFLLLILGKSFEKQVFFEAQFKNTLINYTEFILFIYLHIEIKA